MLYDTARQEMRLLSRQAANLSSEQFLRLYSWTFCLYQALYHSILFLSRGEFAQSWNAVEISIDPVQTRPRAREKRVFELMMFAWLMGWSKRRPFDTIEGVHDDMHPFVKNYCIGSGIDLGKLMRGRVRWPDSKQAPGLQLADLCAAAVYEAASDPTDPEKVALFGSIMRASRYGSAIGPCLFSPFDPAPDDFAERFQPLCDVIARSRS
jgi:hypothetical protein